MKWIEKVFLSAAKHKSTILTVTSIVGVVGTMILSARAGVRSERKLEELRDETPEPTTGEQVKAVAPEWIIPTAVAAATIYSIIKNKQVNDKKIAGIAAFAAGAIKLNQEKQKALKEQLSASKAKTVENEALIGTIEDKPMIVDVSESVEEVIYFVDSWSGHVGLATMTDFKRMREQAKELYEKQGYLCLCDIYYLLDEEDIYIYNSTGLGEEVGFNKHMYEEFYDDEEIPEFDISCEYIGVKNGIRVFRIDYTLQPEWGFMEY